MLDHLEIRRTDDGKFECDLHWKDGTTVTEKILKQLRDTPACSPTRSASIHTIGTDKDITALREENVELKA